MHLTTSLQARWFWYSVLTIVFWGGWAMLEKMGSQEIDPRTV